MVLDVRAQILCNLGPVISGSVRDDHVQGQGLVMTTGELVIAGLITPAHGDRVTLGYVTPDGAAVARFPRGPFRVTKAFANPLSNQTQISIADELAFQKGKGGGVINGSLVDALKGRPPKVAKAIDLREAFDLVAQRAGITVGNVGSWKLTKQIAALNADDYVETLSDMLASVSRFGYLDAQGKLQATSYKKLGNNGPVVSFADVVDVNPNDGGTDFTENPIGNGNAQAVTPKEEEAEPQYVYVAGPLISQGSYGDFVASWDSSGGSTSTAIQVTLKDGSTRTFSITETVLTQEQKAEPDNRTLQRTTITSTALVKVNSQVVQDYLNAGLSGPSPNTQITSRKTDSYSYQQLAPPPLSAQEQAQIDQEIESARQEMASGGFSTSPILTPGGTIVLLPKLPTFRVTRHEATETMSVIEALGRIGVKDYTKMGELPGGENIKEVVQTDYVYGQKTVKEIKRTFVAYGLTQMGQQAISAAAAKATSGSSLQPFVDQFFRLVLEDFVITTRDADQASEEQPIPNYLAPYQHRDVVIQGGSRIQVGGSPEPRPNRALSFGVPFLPDDVVNDDGSVSKGEAASAAAEYAEEQNRLLLGHRLGLQVTTALGVLPTQPLGAFHLQNNGITATYRTNGTVWTFDANSCLVSTDALYWGLAGGDVNGPRWTPVAPGTTALPIPPPVVNNGPQTPANSIPLEDPLDETDTEAIADLLDSLPDDESETFPQELTPPALALPYKPILESTLQVRLQLDTLLVPFGINRSMGEVEGQWRLQLEAVQAVAEEVRLQVESGERELLAEGFSAGLGLGGNLS